MEQNEDAYIDAFDQAVQLRNDLKTKSLFNELKENKNRYHLIKLIGEGAVKKVYLAQDTMMDRQVAYAEIKSDIPLLIEDFLKEARLTSTLEHPYIAPIHDVGINSSEKPFFIMKLYEGESLLEFLNKSSEQTSYSDLEKRLDIFLKVCEAISFAHSKKVLHLDIKPSNIRINHHGEVLLCDWGIARLIYDDPLPESHDEPHESLISEATMLGVIRGTPGYMAPEQKNKDFRCDERTDVYGLGALFHKMLTGSNYEDNFEKIIQLEHCPNELKEICKKSLSEKPLERYQTVAKLIKDLHFYREGLVIQAETATLSLILKKWVIRHKLIVTLSFAYITILCSILFYYFYQLNSERTKLNNVVQNLHDERQEKLTSEKLQAQQYYTLALEAYVNATSKYNFRAGNIRLAIEMLDYSIKVIPNYNDALNLKGKLHLLNFELQKALDYFKSSNNSLYYDAFQKFNSYSKETIQVTQSLKLIESARNILDKRLLKHLVGQAIFYIYNDDHDLRELAKGILRITNSNAPKIILTKDTLDVSHNKHFKSIYGVARLNFKEVNLSHTNLGSQQLMYLKSTHLNTLNLSNTKVDHLEYLQDKSIHHLDIQNCKITTLTPIENIQIHSINITGIKANLEPLTNHSSLKVIICDSSQYSILKESTQEKELTLKLTTPAR